MKRFGIRAMKLPTVLLLVVVLSVVGCSKQETVVEAESGTGEGLISSKPVEFTIFANFNNMVFDPEWEVWQEVAKQTNITLKSVISQSNSNEQEAFNLMLSSGKLADIIAYGEVAEMEKLGRDGGMIALNDLIDEHAPNIKELLETESGFSKIAYSLDGNIYQIPKNQELVTSEFWWLRKDWLDKLNLEVPTTADELYAVLTAFRNKDPNGNGLKDEIPLFDRSGHIFPDKYLSLWDSSFEFYARDGKIEFEPLEENFKTAVPNFVKWYEEGLIDPEFFTRGAKSRDVLLSGNLGGFTHDWPSAGNYNETLQESIPNFEMMAFAPPVNQHGVVRERTQRLAGAGWGISSQCKDPVTLIKFMDFIFSDEGSDLMNWGIEDNTYTVNSDGTKQYTDIVMNAEATPLGYLRGIGVQYRIGMNQDGDYEYAFMTPAAKAAAELYNDNLQWFDFDVPKAGNRTSLKYTAEDESEYKKIMTNIRPYVLEKFQTWILGTADFEEDYDEFIATLEDRGVQRAIEINQTAYDTYLGK